MGKNCWESREDIFGVVRMILNIGSGKSKEGDIRLDIYPLENVNKVWNVENGIPYPDNYFDKIICNCIFEHIKNPNNLLIECYRVLKTNGKMNLLTDNAGYLLFHIMKRAIHGNYCDGYGYNEKKDRHYALYTKEHLENHFEDVGFKVNKIEYKMMLGNKGWKKIKRFMVQKIIKLIFNERVGYVRLDCEVSK